MRMSDLAFRTPCGRRMLALERLPFVVIRVNGTFGRLTVDGVARQPSAVNATSRGNP
jgi:hypothetical protein